MKSRERIANVLIGFGVLAMFAIALSGLAGCAGQARTTNSPASVNSKLEEANEGDRNLDRSWVRVRVLPRVGGEGFPVTDAKR